MQRNTIFTDKFFTTGSIESANELDGLVGPEDHTELATFLQSEEGKQLKAELSENMGILAQWVYANFPDQDYCKNQFASFKESYIDYEGGDDDLNRQRVELYRRGMSNLRKLIVLIQESNSDVPVTAVTKKYIHTLVETLDLCGPAVERTIGDAYKNFIAQKNMPASLEMKRLALLEEYLKAVMIDKKIKDHATLDRHYVAAIVNQNEVMGINQIKDPNVKYCVDEDLEILQRKTLRSFHKIVSPENIVREFVSELNIEELILGFRFHQSVSIAKLDSIGEDDEFDAGQVVDLSTPDFPAQLYAERYIENSILRRLAQGGYLHPFECIKHDNCEIYYHPGANMRLWYVINVDGKYLPYLEYLTLKAKMFDSKIHVISLLPPQFLSTNNFANIYFVLRQQTSIPQHLYEKSLIYFVKNIQELITVFQNVNDDEQQIAIDSIGEYNIQKIIIENKDIRVFNQLLQCFNNPHLLLSVLAVYTGSERIFLDDLCDSALEQNDVEAFYKMLLYVLPEIKAHSKSYYKVYIYSLLIYADAFITKFPEYTIQILEVVSKDFSIFEPLLNKIDIKNLKKLTNSSEVFLQLLELLPSLNFNTQSFLKLFNQDEIKNLIKTPEAFMLYLATKECLKEKYEVLQLFEKQLSIFINKNNIEKLFKLSFYRNPHNEMKEYIEFVFKHAVNNEKHLLCNNYKALQRIIRILENNRYKENFIQWLGIEAISKIKIDDFYDLSEICKSFGNITITRQLLNLLSSQVIIELLDNIDTFFSFIDLLKGTTENQANDELNIYKLFAEKISPDCFHKNLITIANSEYLLILYEFIQHTVFKTSMEDYILNSSNTNLIDIFKLPKELSQLLQLPFLKNSPYNQQRLLEKLDTELLAKIFTTGNFREYSEHFAEIPVSFFAKLVDTPDFKIELSDDIPDNYVAILPMDKVTVSTNLKRKSGSVEVDNTEETTAKKSKHAASPLTLFGSEIHEESDAPVNEYTSQVKPGSLFDC